MCLWMCVCMAAVFEYVDQRCSDCPFLLPFPTAKEGWGTECMHTQMCWDEGLLGANNDLDSSWRI